jgi:hypothetical protein
LGSARRSSGKARGNRSTHVSNFSSTCFVAGFDCFVVFGCDTISPTPSSFPMATEAVDAVELDASEPSLTLSDIIHTVSPSPSPQLDTGHQRADTASPEPLTEAEITQMRRRVTEMGFSSTDKGKLNTNSREKELVDMVCVRATAE